MLLRRITKHVKDQNWFAVGIDFIIVVIGVFIGLQVANWNDNQQAKNSLAASLGRLDKEVSLSIDLIDKVLSYYENGRSDFKTAREALNVCSESPDGQSALEALLFDLVEDVQPNFVTVALDQLANEGRYQDLLSPEFQQIFVTYAGRLNEEHEQLTSHYEQMWAHHVNYHPGVTSFFPGDDETEAGQWGFRLDRPYEEICTDAVFRTRFINTIGFYSAIESRLVTLKSEVEVFQASLADELARL
ncbi:MAG: hypothetical protein AAF437_12840 [Pseudomonadota bacterium]